MSDILQLDYYYGIEADQFKFYRIPKLLITHPAFKGLSSDAKLAYGLMLDRMSLSISSGWMDDQNRAYIIYTIEQIAKDLDCGRDKAISVLAELDSKKGIGLLEKVRRGLGKPDIIYVKNFASIRDIDTDPEHEKELTNPCNSTEVGKTDFKKSEMSTSRGRENRLQEIGKSDFKKSENQTSGSRENRLQEVGESDPNNTDINNTDRSDTDMSDIYPISLSWGGKVSIKEKLAEKDRQIDRTDETHKLIEVIKKNIEYDWHMQYDDIDNRQLYDEMFQLICETVCVRKGSVTIEGQEFPYEIVRSRFMKLNSDHLEYVRDRMKQTTTKIGNIKRYLLTALYNAPATINHFYQQEVQHDMYGAGGFFGSDEMKEMIKRYDGLSYEREDKPCGKTS